MPSQSRLTDLWVGICCCHATPPCIPMGGNIITGSDNGISGGLSQARLVDTTRGYCGHIGKIVTCSSTAILNSRGKARIGDLVIGCNIGVIVTGNSKHEVGG